MDQQVDNELVILVNEKDEALGTMEPLQAHREGALHRAVSVFIFNNKRELLMQRRAKGKYHSAGLWTNTVCAHPRPGEGTFDTAQRSLQEEMGLTCKLKRLFTFTYKAQLDNDVTEHELVHVFIGHSEGRPTPDTDEVVEWKYMNVDQLDKELRTNGKMFTEWFKICYDEHFFELFG